MRLAVIADVHGNVAALEAVLADIGQRTVERVVNLGDCVSGPLWPRETCERLMEAGFTTVRGNHDRWVATLEPSAMGPSDSYAHATLNEEQRRWLGSLPPLAKLDGEVVLFHARPEDDTAYLVENVENGRLVRALPEVVTTRLGKLRAAVVLCGHSHQPQLLQLPDGPLLLNPGSVGCPAYWDDSPPAHVSEAGSPHARYAILTFAETGVSAEMIALLYDHAAAARRAAANGRPSWEKALMSGFSALP
jgi:predicted phosphodiesterase